MNSKVVHNSCPQDAMRMLVQGHMFPEVLIPAPHNLISPMWLRHLESLCSSPCMPVFVVVGPQVLCRPTPPRLVLSPGGALVACCSGPSVFLWRAEDPFKWLKLQHTRQLTCVAVSPCNCHMAAADISGRVMVWHDVGRERLWGEGNSPSQTQNGPAAQSEGPGGRASGTPGKRGAVVPRQRRAGDFAALISLQHWHSSAVAALCFSADGAYLLSGGAEAVLVLCQLRTGALRFLPRLGGPITGITPLTPASPPTLSAGSGAPAVGAPSLGPGGSAGVGDGRPTVDLGDGALRFSVQCSGVNVVMLVDMAPMSASLLLQGVLMAPVYPGQLPWPAPRPLIRALLPPQLLPPPWVALGAPVVDPLTGLLILPARGARLQFVDVSERSFSAPVAVLQVSLSSRAIASAAGTLLSLSAFEPKRRRPHFSSTQPACGPACPQSNFPHSSVMAGCDDQRSKIRTLNLGVCWCCPALFAAPRWPRAMPYSRLPRPTSATAPCPAPIAHCRHAQGSQPQSPCALPTLGSPPMAFPCSPRRCAWQRGMRLCLQSAPLTPMGPTAVPIELVWATLA